MDSNVIFLCILLPLIIVFYEESKQKKAMMQKIITSKRNGGNTEMKELARKFIGKECLIYPFSGNQIAGVIEEVTDSALLIKNKNTVEAVNLDFVMRIREYPVNKKGKKKSVIMD